MIPPSAVRLAHRTQLEHRIRGFPFAARFRTQALSVTSSEPRITRQLRAAGSSPLIEMEVDIVLPIGSKPPQAEQESIEVADLCGQAANYRIIAVTPLRGQDCYQLGLKSTRATTARTSPFGPPPL